MSTILDHEKQLKHYRISQSEYNKIEHLLGRKPKAIEWPLFSALWSEHCSYKSSKIHLRKFAKTLNETVVNAEGENAGVVDLGHDERIVFKMESHNHPSFIEPYQGAATGVGGILRDIFTMGARPIALGDYLCFGKLQTPKMQFLLDGVVRGIAGYGNSVGVPTVTGQTNFDSTYDKNILVNAMAIGLLRPGEKVALSAAQGPGNLVVYVGAKTGKDGVHGASMASEAFSEDSESKKPNVQIGDPYFEKLLIESCLEVLQQNLVVAIQDMGAAGLTSSSFEMASKGKVGMILKLDQVPVRDSSIQPEEILLSESQERMLLVCEPKKLEAIQKLFQKWGLDAQVIGEVTRERNVQLWWKGEMLTSIDPDLLVENAPVYEREFKPWKSKNQVAQKKDLKISAMSSTNTLSSELNTTRKDIYRQYDQRVGLSTVRGAEHDVAILKLPDSGRLLGFALGCRPSLMQMDARVGALDSVYYPSLQMAIKGIKPVAMTDCLNYGNPEKPEIMSEFVASVEAICEASLALQSPVVSGNVSFYNETLGEGITSTPAIGVVGLGPERKEYIHQIPQDHFQQEGSAVYLLTAEKILMSGGPQRKFFGEVNISEWTNFIKQMTALARAGSMLSNQVVGQGGLGLSLMKMCLSEQGFEAQAKLLPEQLWLEPLYQVIVEVSPTEQAEFELSLSASKIKFDKIGTTKSGQVRLSEDLSWSQAECKKQYNQGLRGLNESRSEVLA